MMTTAPPRESALSDIVFKLPKRVALADSVADSIAWAIATGHFSPNDKLNEVTLAESTGVSRAPIREALKILHAQGIVAGEQNKGYRVAPFDSTAVHQVLEVRLNLESILLRDAILNWRARNETAIALDEPLAAMQRAADQNDRAASLAADLDFHRTIARAAANHVAQTLWEAIARHVLIIFSQHQYRDDDLPSVVRQHLAFQKFIDEMIRSDANGAALS